MKTRSICQICVPKQCGAGDFEDLLDCFELAGLEMQQEIDAYFKKFK